MVVLGGLAGCAGEGSDAEGVAAAACEEAAVALEPFWESLDAVQVAGSASAMRVHLDAAADDLDSAVGVVSEAGDEELTVLVKKLSSEFDWVYNTAQGVLEGGDAEAFTVATARLVEAHKPIALSCGWD